MLYWSRKVSKNYALEISGFHLIRKLCDGLIAFKVRLNLDRFKGDHNPQADFLLVFLNFKIMEVNLYNINHAD